jgi:O-antigen ligase
MSFKINNNYPIYLFILIPFSLVFSIFITEIILIVLTIFFLKKNNTNLKSLFWTDTIIKLILIFYLITIISSLYNYNNLEIFLKNIAYIRFLFYALSISWVLKEYYVSKKYFLYSLISIYFLLFFGSIYEFILKKTCVTVVNGDVPIFYGDFFFCSKNLFIGNLIRFDRISSFFGDEMIVGSFISRLFPLIIYLIYQNLKNENYKNHVFFLITFITTVTTILSGERVSLFYLFLFFLIILIFLNFKFKMLSLSFFLILTFSIVFLFPTLKERIIKQTFSQIFFEDKKITFFSIQHESHAIAAIKIFKDNPSLGIGPKNFRFECKKKDYDISEFSCTTHPHNFYIQLLSETGFLGIVIPLIFLFCILKFYIKIFFKNISNKLHDTDVMKICFYSSFLFSIFPLIPTGNIFNNWLSIIFYLPLGFFLSEKKND